MVGVVAVLFDAEEFGVDAADPGGAANVGADPLRVSDEPFGEEAAGRLLFASTTAEVMELPIIVDCGAFVAFATAVTRPMLVVFDTVLFPDRDSGDEEEFARFPDDACGTLFVGDEDCEPDAAGIATSPAGIELVGDDPPLDAADNAFFDS